MGSYAQALQNSQHWGDLQRQQAIQQNQAASLGIAHVLTSGIHPDTGEALTPQEKIQLAQKNRELQGQLQDLWNPRQNVNQVGHNLAAASGVAMPETTLHKVGDLLHITKPPVAAPGAKTPDQQMQDLRDITQKYQPLPGQQDAEAATFALKAHLRDINNVPDLTDEQKQEASAHALGLPFSGSFKPPVTLTLADGTTMSAQQSAKDGRWYDLNRQPIPPESLAGAMAQGKESSDTRARADFADFKKTNPDYKGTFELWKTEQAAKGRAGETLTFDKATGQIAEKATGKRYIPGDPNNPPHVQAMFRNAAEMDARTKAFQLQLATSRGAAYNYTKPLSVYDASNGNAPGYVTFDQMQKQPGRYIPVGPGAKAIASENLMQDISGTSLLTRKAINKLTPSEDFTPDMKVKVAAAMRADDPHASLDQLLASSALGTLTPNQQDFLIATRQLAENAMAMRVILGAGQGSEDVRNAVRATLPGLLSPDRSYAIRQLNAFDSTIARLHRGVPKVDLRNDTFPPQSAPKTKGKVSISKAMARPENKGVPKAIVQKEIEMQGFEVIQ